MGFLEMIPFAWREVRTPPTEDEIFEAWVKFAHDCTLDEFREAYHALRPPLPLTPDR